MTRCAEPRSPFACPKEALNEADGMATITVNRVAGSDGIVTVDWAITGGTATAGSDYTGPTAGTLRWGRGDTGPKTSSRGLSRQVT